MKSAIGSALTFCVTAACALGLAGCGGSGQDIDVVPVEGTVTLDGAPLSGAFVRFIPQGVAEGGPSYGTTDADGHYVLEYTDELSGAVPGTHEVRISTFSDESEDENGEVVPATPESVPDEYNISSTLTTQVARDGGPYDFELVSGGQISQPDSDDSDE